MRTDCCVGPKADHRCDDCPLDETAYVRGFNAAIIACSSLCGRRARQAQEYAEANTVVSDIRRDEAAACATACRGLLTK